MSSFKTIRGVSVAAMLAIASGLGGANAQDKEPVNYVVSLGLTGLSATFGTAAKEGVELSVKEVNEAGGILGRPVEVTFVDSGLDATKAVSLVQEQIARKPAQVVGCDISSGTALALFALATREEFVCFTEGSSAKLNDPAQFPYGFSATTTFKTAMELVAETIKSEGGKKVGAVLPADAFGDNVLAQFQAGAEAAGLEVVATRFDPKAVDVTPAFLQAMDAKPDYLFVDSTGARVPTILEARLKSGAVEIPTIGGQSIGHIDVPNVVTAAALKNMKILYWKINVAGLPDGSPKQQEIVAKLKAAGSALDQPLNIYAMAHDWLWYYKTAAEQAGSTDAADVAKALESLNVQGDRPWVAWKDGTYTAEMHFPAVQKSDFIIADPASIKDAQFTLSK